MTEETPTGAADEVFNRAMELRTELDAALEVGDQQRAAEIAQARRELQTYAKVSALDTERAWADLLNIQTTLRKSTKKRVRRKRRSLFGASEFTNHLNDGPDGSPSEVEARLKKRELELIELLHEAGECDLKGHPLPKPQPQDRLE